MLIYIFSPSNQDPVSQIVFPQQQKKNMVEQISH